MMQLRPEYQLPAHEATIEHCKNSSDPAIHDHSVGAGKTVSIAFMMKHVVDNGGSALCLARQGDLISQNSADYLAIGGKCSVFSASLGKHSTYYPAIFGTEGTVSNSLKTKFADYKMSLICIDECHEVDGDNVISCIESMKKGESFYNAVDDNDKPLYCQYAIILAHFYKLNPKLRVIGYSGSPFRGSEKIVSDSGRGFWKKTLSTVDTYFLVGLGYLVPPVFGFGSEHYETAKFAMHENGESGDLSGKELQAMQREVTKDEQLTASIVEEFVNRTQNRLSVLITCAGQKHCEQVAKFLPKDSWVIVTEKTKNRVKVMEDIKAGKYKYTLQVNCLGQGVNVTLWDTCVILRKIGSLRYLIQLIGRVLRTLKPDQIDSGLEKHDGLILDYTDTMESAGDIYDHPITDEAKASNGKKSAEMIECPQCSTLNSEFAVRCRGLDTASSDGRCEYFFNSRTCACGTENAPTARNCRACDAIMIDPNDALIRKAYTDADWKPVKEMIFSETSTGKACVEYHLDSTYHKDGIEYPEVAKEYLNPIGKAPYERSAWHKFIKEHIQGDRFRQMMARSRTVGEVLKNKAMFDKPKFITHRRNDKGFSVINRKEFNSGRIETTG